MNQGIAGHVATTGHILNIADAYDDPNFNQAIDKKTGYRTKAILCMPIKANDQTIGVLQLINKCTGAGVFSVDDEDVMMIFLSIAGPILAASNLYSQIQGKSKKKGEGDEMPKEMDMHHVAASSSREGAAPRMSGLVETGDEDEEEES